MRAASRRVQLLDRSVKQGVKIFKARAMMKFIGRQFQLSFENSQDFRAFKELAGFTNGVDLRLQIQANTGLAGKLFSRLAKSD